MSESGTGRAEGSAANELQIPPASETRRAMFRSGAAAVAGLVWGKTATTARATPTVPAATVNPIARLFNRINPGWKYSEIVGITNFDGYRDAQIAYTNLADFDVVNDGGLPEFAYTPYNMYHNGALRISQAAMVQKTLLSERRLFERMVMFFTDHLNVDGRDDKTYALVHQMNQRVTRAHALGDFNAMIRASAQDPAMGEYLDNAHSNGNPGPPPNTPNENYARELMELHTLGVDYPYSEDDVKTLSYMLSGLTYETSTGSTDYGVAGYDSTLHGDPPPPTTQFLKHHHHHDGPGAVAGSAVDHRVQARGAPVRRQEAHRLVAAGADARHRHCLRQRGRRCRRAVPESPGDGPRHSHGAALRRRLRRRLPQLHAPHSCSPSPASARAIRFSERACPAVPRRPIGPSLPAISCATSR